MQKIRTHYDNLKVSRDAPAEVIRAAYKSLSLKYHPDRNANSPESQRAMKIINGSYAILSDPEMRRIHDAWIAEKEAEKVDVSSQEPRPNATDAEEEQKPVVSPGKGFSSGKTLGWGFVLVAAIFLFSKLEQSELDWRQKVAMTRTAMSNGTIALRLGTIVEYPNEISAIDDLYSVGVRALNKSVSNEIERENVWWVSSDIFYIKIVNSSSNRIAAVTLSANPGSCESSASANISYLNLTFDTLLEPDSSAVYSANLPFSYTRKFGGGTACTIVQSAFSPQSNQ